MKHYYSIVAFSTTSKQYDEPLVLVEPGINAFTVLTSDVESLLERLRVDGIRVDALIQLDSTTDATGISS
jgi:hypothetical protein